MKHLGVNTNNEDVVTQQENVPLITVSTTAPSSPSVGDLWVDTN